MDEKPVDSPRLLLFGKIPRPGRVKTRLCPPLEEDDAAELYGAFLQDVVRASRIDGVSPSLWVWPIEERAALPELPDVELRAQEGADLPERMQAAFDAVFAEDSRPAILRNTDAPLLPAERIREAIRAFADGADVVLGPDRGGGYYLVGLARALLPDAGLFDVIREGSPETVFERTMTRLRALRLTTFVLPVEDDVDVPEDLERLRRVLSEDPALAPATSKALQRLDKRLEEKRLEEKRLDR